VARHGAACGGFDRRNDPGAKERLYEMIDAVGEYRRKVA